MFKKYIIIIGGVFLVLIILGSGIFLWVNRGKNSENTTPVSRETVVDSNDKTNNLQDFKSVPAGSTLENFTTEVDNIVIDSDATVKPDWLSQETKAEYGVELDPCKLMEADFVQNNIPENFSFDYKSSDFAKGITSPRGIATGSLKCIASGDTLLDSFTISVYSYESQVNLDLEREKGNIKKLIEDGFMSGVLILDANTSFIYSANQVEGRNIFRGYFYIDNLQVRVSNSGIFETESEFLQFLENFYLELKA